MELAFALTLVGILALILAVDETVLTVGKTAVALMLAVLLTRIVSDFV